jgi:hypothetical protein
MSLIRRPRRPGRALIVLLVVALISAVAKFVWSNGVIASVTPGYGGSCKTVATTAGVQDMEAAGDSVFLSVAGGDGKRDGIYAMTGAATPVKLDGAPKDFHPRGIGLFRTPDGKGLFLFAVNRHSSGRFSVDSFEVTDPATAPKLVAQGTVEGGLMINPQDVAAVTPTSFYVANGTASKNPLIHWMQAYGLISGGDVLFFNGTTFREAVDGLYGTRSIVMVGDRVIVGGLLSRSVSSFSREDITGNLNDEQDIHLPAGPEKLTRDADGGIWAAAHANLLSWRGAGAGKPATSQVFRVGLGDHTVQQVYGNAGAEISGASVALSLGNKLLIGSPLDGKLLSCGNP